MYGGGAFFFGFSAFFKPISEDFGWTRAATAGAISLSQAEGFIEGPIIGPLVDKYGPRKLMVIGISMVSLGFFALSIVNGLLTYYLVYVVLLAIGFNTGFFVAAIAGVGNWFVRKRSLALGVLSTANGFGGAIMAPVIAWLILNYGWRPSAVILALGMAIIGIPLALVVRHRPEQYGYLPDGDVPISDGNDLDSNLEGDGTVNEINFTVWEAMRTSSFWLLAVAFSLRTMAIAATVVHQIPFLTDKGISLQSAAGILALMGLMSIPGRLGFGILGDYMNKRYLLTIALALQGIGILILVTADSIQGVILFTFVFGLGWGAPNLLFAIRADYFGRKYFATIAGVQQSVVAIGTIVGPVFAGLVYDINQSYTFAFVTFILAIGIASICAFMSKPPDLPARLINNNI